MIVGRFMDFHMTCVMDFIRVKGYNYIENFFEIDKGAA